MQKESRLLDDLARMMSGAMSSFSSLRGEAEGRVRQQLERVLAGMDLVGRDEFEAVQAMAAKAREENEALAARLAVLEKASSGEIASSGTSARRSSATTKTSTTKTSTKKPATKSGTARKRTGGGTPGTVAGGEGPGATGGA